MASNTTTDHDEIRSWVEERGGKPAKVSGTEGGGSEMLRIQFSEDSRDNLEEISWDEFFEEFEDNNLAEAGSKCPGYEARK